MFNKGDIVYRLQTNGDQTVTINEDKISYIKTIQIDSGEKTIKYYFEDGTYSLGDNIFFTPDEALQSINIVRL